MEVFSDGAYILQDELRDVIQALRQVNRTLQQTIDNQRQIITSQQRVILELQTSVGQLLSRFPRKHISTVNTLLSKEQTKTFALFCVSDKF